MKLCECGCGNPAPIAKMTDPRFGHVKGEPKRFIHGHNTLGTTNKSGGNKRHSMSRTPEHNAYCAARQRSTNQNLKNWKDYGGRGIRFLFTSFEQWFAELGPRPSPKHSVDRIDNGGNYEPGNVRWSTKAEQALNRRKKCLLAA